MSSRHVRRQKRRRNLADLTRTLDKLTEMADRTILSMFGFNSVATAAGEIA